MTTIENIESLPCSPFTNLGNIGIVITPGVPSFFRITGTDLDQITSIEWFPKNPSSVVFQTRQLILVNHTVGTFMIKVIENYLNCNNRGGKISIRLLDGSTISVPVTTYGPVSLGPLWQEPGQGLITG